jgi:hypothetical protein
MSSSLLNFNAPNLQGNCELMGDMGLLTQLGLLLIMMTLMVVKRYTEQNVRPWRIWAIVKFINIKGFKEGKDSLFYILLLFFKFLEFF